MVYNKIGQSGLYVSRICLGTMAFGRLCDEKESFRIMDEAVEKGITFFDTANIYGRGASEEIIGKWFAQGGGRREKAEGKRRSGGRMGNGRPPFRASSRAGLPACRQNPAPFRRERLPADSCLPSGR